MLTAPPLPAVLGAPIGNGIAAAAAAAAVAPAGAAAALVALTPGSASGWPAAGPPPLPAGLTGDNGPLASLLRTAGPNLGLLPPAAVPAAAAAPRASRCAKGLAAMSATGAVSSEPTPACAPAKPGAAAAAAAAPHCTPLASAPALPLLLPAVPLPAVRGVSSGIASKGSRGGLGCAPLLVGEAGPRPCRGVSCSRGSMGG